MFEGRSISHRASALGRVFATHRAVFAAALVTALCVVPCEGGTSLRASVVGSDAPSQPLFQIVADSLYDAGAQQGAAAKERIQKWLAGTEMQAIRAYTMSLHGKPAFEELKRRNAASFPDLVSEMRGVAFGAGVSLDEVWAANMVEELEALMHKETFVPEHCTDVYAHEGSGAPWLGHNEDWSQEVAPLVYWVAIRPRQPGAFTPCGGFVYPGQILGNAATWSESLFVTQNSLYPVTARADGLASTFVQRAAVCGGQKTVAGLVSSIRLAGGQANGFSLNIASLRNGDMANLEIAGDLSSLYSVHGNYSHMNMYKQPDLVSVGVPNDSTVHRQARVDALPPPTSRESVLAILGDTADGAFPLYRPICVCTVLLSVKEGRVEVWLHPHNPSKTAPTYTWSLPRFFDY